MGEHHRIQSTINYGYSSGLGHPSVAVISLVCPTAPLSLLSFPFLSSSPLFSLSLSFFSLPTLPSPSTTRLPRPPFHPPSLLEAHIPCPHIHKTPLLAPSFSIPFSIPFSISISIATCPLHLHSFSSSPSHLQATTKVMRTHINTGNRELTVGVAANLSH